MQDLIIKDVPEDKTVIEEILANAESTISNYHARNIKIVEKEKVDLYDSTILSFRTANKLRQEPIKEIIEEPIKEDEVMKDGNERII
jgi:hypothetical protein